MNTFQYNCFEANHSSIYDVIAQMEALQTELQVSSLANLKYFNKTYLLITQTVHKGMQENKFQDNARMEHFDIQFARYYFTALKSYTQNKPTPPAWQTCFEYCSNPHVSPTIAMALGVNAHVNNDLPQTLQDCNFKEGYKSDYNKVNQEIRSQIPDVIRYLQDTSQPFSTLQKKPGIYFQILYTVICNWRADAWKKHYNLLSGKTSKEKIELSAKNMAHILKRISK